MRTKQLYFATKARTHDSARTHKTPHYAAFARTHASLAHCGTALRKMRTASTSPWLCVSL
jgi:hypothetical protein